MKKFKEFVKKIGNKKRCLLCLLLAGLLLFAIVGGLNGSKSAKTEVNAISAPTTKNLDLNGVRYTYQTSLKELKNNYNIFTHWSYRVFTIKEDSEGVTELYIGSMQESGGYDDTEWSQVQNNIKNSISIEYDDVLIESIISTNENRNTKECIFEFDNAPSQTEITGIKINYNYLLEVPLLSSEITQDLDYISVVYLNNDNANDLIVDTYVNYIKSKEIYYKFKKINGYSVMGIIGAYNSVTQEGNDENCLYGDIPVTNFNESSIISCTTESHYFIDELNFYNNYFTFRQINTYLDYVPYMGYLLLSESKYDETFINDISSVLNSQEKKGMVNLSGGFFGGKFNDNQSSGTIYYGLSEVGLNPVDRNILYVSTRQNYIGFMIFKNFNKINYFEQNQLLYLDKINSLKGEFDGKEYSGLSSQIDDVLYNVNYTGTQKEEFEKKVQDDLTDLLKTTGIGAVIGLFIGFLIGNPVGGLVIGAVIGFAVSIIPLIIDGLQTLFGYDFLSGLYNFFNAITEFFVNIIDTIVNFLLSIITNPFVLVLIVLVAILYIFVIRPKIK